MATSKMDQEYQKVTDRLCEAMEKGVLPWSPGWVMGTPLSLASGQPYKGVNVLLLGWQGYKSPYWLTFNQARKQGGHVRKGEKGSLIVKWTPFEKDKVGKDGKPERFMKLFTHTVFNVEQCEGVEAPPVPGRTSPFTPIQECENIVAGWKGKPAIVHGGNRACYSPSQDLISMPTQESFFKEEEYYSTLFHEMVHSTGHMTRLAREGITNPIKFASHDYSFEELVAECGAAYLCGRAGIIDHTVDRSAAYLQSWIRKLRSEPKWFIQAAGKAVAASNLILGVGDEMLSHSDSDEDAA